MTTDKSLVLRTLTKKDEVAYAALMERHKGVIWAYIRQRERDSGKAEDVLQKVFVTAFFNLSSLRDPSAFRGFVFGIAKNILHEHARRAKRKLEKTTKLVDEIPDPSHEKGVSTLVASVEDGERSSLISTALAELDDSSSAVITLRYLEQLSYREIGAQLGLKTGTVSSLIHRALKNLERRLKPILGEAATYEK
ncbi:MAG: sigma-70 family RNA polymerase sigma factor [Planctomycetota bacterium]|nr:sigma-70 family RNA polymerase sigma factor [Planctomycetota bacterium]